MELKIKSLCAEIEIKKDDEKNYASMVIVEKFADVETVINVILNKKDIFELCDFFQEIVNKEIGIKENHWIKLWNRNNLDLEKK